MSQRRCLSSMEKVGFGRARLPSGDGGDDADFVGFLHGGGLIFEEADVFAANVDIHEAADVAGLVADTIPDTREGGFEVVDDFADGRAGGADALEVIGEFAKRGG